MQKFTKVSDTHRIIIFNVTFRWLIGLALDCAKRSLRPSAGQNKVFRPFVSNLSNFYEADMRGGHMALNSETLKTWFLNVR